MNLDSKIERDIKVSVCVVAYNHEKYIRECLESLIFQNVDFDYEIIVGDDASTDGTRRIIEDLSEKYPNRIVPIIHETNIGPVANYFSVHKLARGRYVCHMDGDDVSAPEKLREQANFMDVNKDVSLLWHRMSFLKSKEINKNHPPENAFFLNTRITKSDLILYGSMGSHSSLMYRRENFSLRYINFPALDWIVAIELMGDGYGFILPQVLGKYRIHSNGISGGAVASEKMRELFCECQLEILKRFPEYRSSLALRSLLTAALDLKNMKGFFLKSLVVFFRCKSFPDIRKISKLMRFYKESKFPKELR